MEKIVVTIDIDLEDLIPGYLGNRQKDIRSIEAALDQGDFEGIRVLAHSMKGSGGGYGFDGITEIGAALEKAAIGRNAPSIREELTRLTDYLSKVEVVYEEQ
jgi:histidine phosphotransfer protein HptB